MIKCKYIDHFLNRCDKANLTRNTDPVAYDQATDKLAAHLRRCDSEQCTAIKQRMREEAKLR